MANDAAEQRLRIAFELADAGIALMRENLRRRHPDATSEELDRRMNEWLQRRPPDGPGRPGALS